MAALPVREQRGPGEEVRVQRRACSAAVAGTGLGGAREDVIGLCASCSVVADWKRLKPYMQSPGGAPA